MTPPVDTAVEVVDQPFDAESVGDSEDADLVPLQSGEDWVAQLDDDLSRPASQAGETFRITALQLQDTTCITLLVWIRSDAFPSWAEVKSLCPELRFLWHHRNNLSADANGVIWRKRCSPGSQLQLLVPRPTREQLFLAYHASLFGGHLGRTILRGSTILQKAGGIPSTIAYDSLGWNVLAVVHSLINVRWPARPCWWIWPSLDIPDRSSITITSLRPARVWKLTQVLLCRRPGSRISVQWLPRFFGDTGRPTVDMRPDETGHWREPSGVFSYVTYGSGSGYPSGGIAVATHPLIHVR